MKRKFLEDMGIEKENIDAIMKENGTDIEEAKGKVTEVEKALEQATEQLAERDKQLEELKAASGSNADLQKQIEDLQAENKRVQEERDAEIADMKLTAAVEKALGDTVHDAGMVIEKLDKSKLVVGEDGTVTGLDEQVTPLKESKAFLFKEQKPTQQQIRGGKPAEGKETPPAADKKPSEMTYSEMCAYLEANPGAQID